MSDYLWDKTGEPDEEIERLEELLGGFGHKPRALELPAESAPLTSLFGRARRFSPALVAAAAALVLMILAGALVMLRQGGAVGVGQSAEAGPRVSTPQQKESVVTTPEEPKPSVKPTEREAQAGRGSTLAKESKTPDFQAPTGGRRRPPSTGSRGAGVSRHQASQAAAQEPQVAAHQGPPAPTRVEQQAAKEQLVYALRLASAKLNEVRKMTRGGDTPPRQSFDERNRIR